MPNLTLIALLKLLIIIMRQILNKIKVIAQNLDAIGYYFKIKKLYHCLLEFNSQHNQLNNMKTKFILKSLFKIEEILSSIRSIISL